MILGALRRLRGYLRWLRGKLGPSVLWLGDLGLDLVDIALRRRKDLTPPRRHQRYVGSGDFHSVGEEFLGHLKELCDLEPDSSILDVGSGIGRMAVPLTRFMSANARYEGFDIVPLGIHWCARNITPRFPHFKFQIADIYNKFYYPKGRFKASEYEFPFDSNTFDVVVLTSVFTHMLQEDVDHYLEEIARVTKPGGRVLATFFILDSYSVSAIKNGNSEIPFGPDHGGYRLMSETFPEMAIGFDQELLFGMIGSHGLEVKPPIHNGKWRGGGGGRSFQDILILQNK